MSIPTQTKKQPCSGCVHTHIMRFYWTRTKCNADRKLYKEKSGCLKGSGVLKKTALGPERTCHGCGVLTKMSYAAPPT